MTKLLTLVMNFLKLLRDISFSLQRLGKKCELLSLLLSLPPNHPKLVQSSPGSHSYIYNSSTPSLKNGKNRIIVILETSSVQTCARFALIQIFHP